MTTPQTRVSRGEIQRRHASIRKAMEETEVDALVIGCAPRGDRRGVLRYVVDSYLQLFEEFTVIPQEGPIGYFAHDKARAEYIDDLHLVEHTDILDPAEPGGKVAAFAKRAGPGRIGLCGTDSLSAKYYLSLINSLDGYALADFTKTMDGVRMVKSDEEINISNNAVKLNEETFKAWLASVREGEEKAKSFARASSFAAEAGCEDQYWLASFGASSPLCLPHALDGSGTWKKGDSGVVVLEHTAAGGYFGEVMRTCFLGSVSREAEEAFTTISRILQLAGSAIKAGITAGEIADLIDGYLVEYGFLSIDDTGKPHGHGQGLDITEPPLLVSGDPTVIKPGTRLNIHPRIKLASGLEITSTDCYVATESGSIRLSTLPHEPMAIR